MSAKTDRQMSVEKAMSCVLGAEQEALAQIAACERRADNQLQDSRQTVRALVRRTQARISRLHARCLERNRELVAQMERDAARADESPTPGASRSAARQEAVRALARELTTPESADDG